MERCHLFNYIFQHSFRLVDSQTSHIVYDKYLSRDIDFPKNLGLTFLLDCFSLLGEEQPSNYLLLIN